MVFDSAAMGLGNEKARVMSMTVDHAASWNPDFMLTLSLREFSVASRLVTKSRMINFPMHVASPTTITPIIKTIPRPSQLSDTANIAVPLRVTHHV